MPDWMIQLLGMAGVAVGIYAGIRADLAALRVMAEQAAHEAGQAHARIDQLLMRSEK